MARVLISSQPFIGTPFPSSTISRHGGLYALPHRRLVSTGVRLSFNEIPLIPSFNSSLDFQALFTKAESLIYTLADAAVATDPAFAAAGTTDAAAQKNGGWFGFISDSMEFVLKVKLPSIYTHNREINEVVISQSTDYLLIRIGSIGVERWIISVTRALRLWICDYIAYHYS